MTSERGLGRGFFARLGHKPITLLGALFAAAAVLFSLYQRAIGNVYIGRLNYVDATTLIMVGVLLLRAVTKLNHESDLETASMALIGALSFVFAYEAIYKWSFYFLPWRMSPGELREWVIQIAISLVVTSAFARGTLRLTRASALAAAAFAVGWIIWLLVGYPQLADGGNIHPAVIDIPFTPGLVYAVNRGTKLALCLVYYFMYV